MHQVWNETISFFFLSLFLFQFNKDQFFFPWKSFLDHAVHTAYGRPSRSDSIAGQQGAERAVAERVGDGHRAGEAAAIDEKV